MTASPRRRPGLDGLRGVAALVVVFHHVLLTSSGWAAAYAGISGGGMLLAYTPFHVLVDGTLAVYVFFVLSGFVLVRQLDGGAARYYVSRMLRLYVPVWAAVAFAVVAAAVVQRRTTGSWWLAIHAGALSSRSVFDQATLWQNSWLISVLWSLRWEVLFSLALPLYLLVARRVRRDWPVAAALLLASSAVGIYSGHEALHFMPMFGLGVLLAMNEQALPTIPVKHLRSVAGVLLVLGSVFWLLPRTSWSEDGIAVAVASTLQLAAAAGIVLIALRSRESAAALSRRVPRWLGSRSFALYLVHEPIVVSVALLTDSRWALTLVLAVPLSLLAAELFFRLVERPSHRFARAAGGWAAGLYWRRPALAHDPGV